MKLSTFMGSTFYYYTQEFPPQHPMPRKISPNHPTTPYLLQIRLHVVLSATTTSEKVRNISAKQDADNTRDEGDAKH